MVARGPRPKPTVPEPSTAMVDSLDAWCHWSAETKRWYIRPAAWTVAPEDVVMGELAVRLGLPVKDRKPLAQATVMTLLDRFKDRCATRAADVVLESTGRGPSAEAMRWNTGK